MSEPVVPSVGWGVLHLFCKPTPLCDAEAVAAALKDGASDGHQVVTASILGHKADLCVLAIGPDLRHLRRLQTALQHAGLDIVDSYVSLTEASEYSKGLPQEMVDARLYPNLPPPDKSAFCFYPMSKKRDVGANWFTLPYDERKELMHEHGTSGRKFAGRIVQLVTGSAGFDDFEWGVTLFGTHPDDLKEVVYTMRFDTASALYGDFGTFYVGMVASIDEILSSQ
jgi:hydrogen peroxide-dependent heme synthase